MLVALKWRFVSGSKRSSIDIVGHQLNSGELSTARRCCFMHRLKLPANSSTLQKVFTEGNCWVLS